jgi:predicted CXXCH cytochrome family protein
MVPELPSRSLLSPASFRVLQNFLRIAWVLVLAASPALAKTHPVPLEKNVDSAKCLECHEDKTKGKAVHSAIATGCLSCHEVRVSRDVTRVKLITTTSQALCLSCHDEKKVQPGQTIHSPAVRDCVKCHDPHQWAISRHPDDAMLHLRFGSFLFPYNRNAAAEQIGMAQPWDGYPMFLPDGTQVR